MDWSALFLIVPLAFALGWFASRMDLRQLRVAEGQQPKAFFRGLNHLLNEEQDQAIDAFVEAVTHDPEASELHFALGNLFRKRGDYERAVRVHRHMLARGDISKTDRIRAQQALAQDFWTAGLLDRAQTAFEALLDTPLAMAARVGLLAVFERGRDWSRALETAQALEGARTQSEAVPLDAATQAVLDSLQARCAHYHCELAQAALGANKSAVALRHWQQAAVASPRLARPWVDQGRWHLAQGDDQAALVAFERVAQVAVAQLPLIASQMAQAARSLGADASARVRDLLRRAQTGQSSIDISLALADLAETADDARLEFAAHLKQRQSLVAATRWLALERLEHEQFHPELQRTLDEAVKPLQRYQCSACNFSSQTHFWRCPGCQSWDSMPANRVEEL